MDKCSSVDAMQTNSTCNLALNQGKSLTLFKHGLPDIAEYLDLQSFWNLRAVCKDWKHDLDNYIAARHPEFIQDKLCVKLHSPETFARVCQMIVNSDVSNPFPGGGVSIKMTYDARPHVISLLDKFGDQVQHLHLNISETPTGFAYLLKDCVQRTPNLKGLYIQGQIEPELMHFVRVAHFPVLKKLEVLQLKISNDVPRMVARLMLVNVLRLEEHAIQLKKLYLKIGNIANYADLLPYCENLDELELVFKTKVAALDIAGIFNSPIKTLALDIGDMEEEIREQYFGNVLRIVKRVKRSLTRLWVNAPQEFQDEIRNIILLGEQKF